MGKHSAEIFISCAWRFRIVTYNASKSRHKRFKKHLISMLSMTSTSLLHLLMTLPTGVWSKNDIGALSMFLSMRSWRIRDAFKPATNSMMPSAST